MAVLPFSARRALIKLTVRLKDLQYLKEVQCTFFKEAKTSREEKML